MAIRRAWSRFGALPALPLVVVLFVLAGVAAVLPSSGVVRGTVIGALLVLVAYCVARPSGGWDVFGWVALPNILAGWAHSLVGAPRWLYFVLVPIALLGARDVDRSDRAAGRAAVDGDGTGRGSGRDDATGRAGRDASPGDPEILAP